jgi:hypothetical protein
LQGRSVLAFRLIWKPTGVFDRMPPNATEPARLDP